MEESYGFRSNFAPSRMFSIKKNTEESFQFEKFVLFFVVAAVTFFTRLIFFRPVKRVGNSRPLRTPVTKHVDQMRTDFFRYELPQTDFKDLR